MGAISLLCYLLYRMMKNEGWDDSNITNALRLLSHVTLHPQDFGKMWYHTGDMRSHRPFWYVDKDELSEVVMTRPPSNGVTKS
jgi:hypothetical protein